MEGDLEMYICIGINYVACHKKEICDKSQKQKEPTRTSGVAVETSTTNSMDKSVVGVYSSSVRYCDRRDQLHNKK